MTTEIRKSMRKRDRYHRKAKLSNLPHHWATFRQLRKSVISLIRCARDNHLVKTTNVLADNNTPAKQWWHLAKQAPKRAINNISSPILEHQGQLLNHLTDKAEVFYEYFSNISNPEHTPNPPVDVPPVSAHQLDHIEVSEQEVIDQLCNLNINKACGPDGISSRILKELAVSLGCPLALIFNKSLALNKVSTIWKESNVTPVYKGKGPTSLANNYRPIALTSCIGKLMENVVLKNLFNYIGRHIMYFCIL
jgi:hypothetical protein